MVKKLPPADQLYQEYEKATDIQALASKYGVKRIAVYESLRRAGYDTRAHAPGSNSACPYTADELLALYDTIGVSEIVTRTGYSTSVVYKWLQQAGYVPKHKGRPRM